MEIDKGNKIALEKLYNSCNVSGGRKKTVSLTDMKLSPAGRNTGIQPPHK